MNAVEMSNEFVMYVDGELSRGMLFFLELIDGLRGEIFGLIRKFFRFVNRRFFLSILASFLYLLAHLTISVILNFEPEKEGKRAMKFFFSFFL